MGYSLFASRKIYYTALINNIEIQLDSIVQEKQSLLALSANITDGVVTPEELASDPKNLNNYIVFKEESSAFNTSEEGGANVSSVLDDYMNSEGYDDNKQAILRQLLKQSIGEEFAKGQAKKLAVAECQLELQQKRLETRLTAAQKQLEAIEQAEARAIQQAVPKYSGLG